jgi:Domain of unknown function (DUF4397)
MKSIKQNIKRWPVVLGVVCLVALALPSCVKSNHNVTPTKPIAGLAFVDACPDASALDFYLSGQQVNLQPIALGNYFNYFNAYAGNVPAVFYQSGTTTLVAKDTISISANHSYTLFLTNVEAHADFILTKDSVTAPASGTISVRLVNASPNAGAVDLIVKGASTSIVQNALYKSVSGFMSATVTATDSLQVRQSGTSTILATVPASHFTPGSVYTVWLYGLANASVPAQKLNAGIMQNAYFY